MLTNDEVKQSILLITTDHNRSFGEGVERLIELIDLPLRNSDGWIVSKPYEAVAAVKPDDLLEVLTGHLEPHQQIIRKGQYPGPYGTRATGDLPLSYPSRRERGRVEAQARYRALQSTLATAIDVQGIPKFVHFQRLTAKF